MTLFPQQLVNHSYSSRPVAPGGLDQFTVEPEIKFMGQGSHDLDVRAASESHCLGAPILQNQ